MNTQFVSFLSVKDRSDFEQFAQQKKKVLNNHGSPLWYTLITIAHWSSFPFWLQ